MATWKVLDFGRVPTTGAVVISYDCPGCGHEAELPVLGMAIAQTAGGVVFEPGTHAIPAIIQCRHCRRRFEAA